MFRCFVFTARNLFRDPAYFSSVRFISSFEMSAVSESAGVGNHSYTKTRHFDRSRPAKRRKIQQTKLAKEGSNEEVLLADVRKLLAAQKLAESFRLEETILGGQDKLPETFTEIEVKIKEL